MITEKKLLKAYNRVNDAANELTAALENLSRLATTIYGEELTADFCNGYEIEFRHNDVRGYVDDDCTIRIEDLLKSLKK